MTTTLLAREAKDAKEILAPATRKTVLLGAIAIVRTAFARGPMHSLNYVENCEIDVVRAASIVGTPLQSVADSAAIQGIETDGTVGDLMDKLDLTQADIHALACNCIGEVSPERAEHELRRIAG